MYNIPAESLKINARDCEGCCGWVPVFLFPALLDHVMSFFCCCTELLDISVAAITRSNVLTLDNVYISLFVRIAWSCPTYISLVVRIGLFRPNKVLTQIYKWICTLQRVLI